MAANSKTRCGLDWGHLAVEGKAPYESDPEWPVVRLADATTKIGSGATPRGGSESYRPRRETWAFVRSQNVFDRRFDSDALAFISDEQAHGLRGVSLQPGDVLLNITGDGVTFGRAAVVASSALPACVNQHVAIVRADTNKAVPGYLLAFLTHPEVKPYIASFNSGGSRRAITKGHIESFQVPLPPLAEQSAIAATLGALDDKIESCRRAAALSLEVLDALSSRAAANQVRVPLGSIAQLEKTVAKPASYGDQVVSHYSIPAFDAGARAERVAASSVMSNKIALKGPVILVSRLNPRFNRTWWAMPAATEVAFASPEFAMLRADSRRALAGVWLAVRDETFRDEITKRVTGTSGSHQRIRPDDILAVEVPDSRLMLDELLDGALALLDRVESLRTEIDALGEVRDALLPELLSGRVRALGAVG